MTERGRLVAIEGLSASGKTTLCDGLAAALREAGLPTHRLRDPGGSPLGEAIRELVPHRQTDRAAALLYAAARAQTVEEVVRPALARGDWVVTARWTPSSLVYEGEALGLGVEAVRWLCDFSTAGVRPDRVLVLTLDPALARARRIERDGGAAAGPQSDVGKRIQKRVRAPRGDGSGRAHRPPRRLAPTRRRSRGCRGCAPEPAARRRPSATHACRLTPSPGRGARGPRGSVAPLCTRSTERRDRPSRRGAALPSARSRWASLARTKNATLPGVPAADARGIYRAPMLYRIRRYAAVPERLVAFNDFFSVYLLPIRARHGARLVGRWETEEAEVIAVWEYDDKAAYERIDAAVRADPDSAKAREHRETIGQLFTERHETFARSTLEDPGRQ